MLILHKILFTTLLIFISLSLYGQNKEIKKNYFIDTAIFRVDSLFIVPGSLILSENGKLVSDSLYTINYGNSTIQWDGNLPTTIQLTYRTFSFDLSQKTATRDTSIIREKYTFSNPFRSNPTKGIEEIDLLDVNSLNKSGSISRGITVGNTQNLGVNSNFNLQLSGKIANEISILASITDDNIPIQPDGTTQQLQDFDQVFIQVFNDEKWRLTAGDYFTQSKESYFMQYTKKAKGVSFEKKINLTDSNSLYTKTDLAISRGKFSTNTFNGIEGNQGPYKLIGAENETTIIVLSGTEQVFMDGKLLDRGADKDYIIDYNTAEITFTPKQLITKNKRILIQFQYSDQNYIRSLATTQLKLETKHWKSLFQVYSEQDQKNQPLQQDLSNTDKQVLFSIGDTLNQAFVLKEDSVLGEENAVLYEKKDSLGYSVYVFSTNKDSLRYRLRFSNVGNGNGNYIQDGFSPFGKVYRWIKPDTVGSTIIKNGNFEPFILLVAPKSKQLITMDNLFVINENISFNTDFALSRNDINTFSPIDNKDNLGFGSRFGFMGTKKLSTSKKPIVISNQTNVEYISNSFSFVERYRAAEFSRNWNILNQTYTSNQLLSYSNFGIKKENIGSFNYTINVLDIDTFYRGIKQDVLIHSILKSLSINYTASYLNSTSSSNTSFFRHKSELIQDFNFFKLGYQDEFENNQYKLNDSLLLSSYQFYDGTVFIQNGDSAIVKYKLYASLREEKNTQENKLTKSAYSNDIGLNYGFISKNNLTKFSGNTAYRKLHILDTTLGKAPENTFLNQTDFSTSILKRLIDINTFYQIGSGLEQKREFLYIEVNPGQGNYAWIDYNGNGVKELNEFEVAIYKDQANYIRVFTQSNAYITAFTNKFSQSVRVDPKNILRNTNNTFLKGLSLLSNFTSYTSDRKTTQENFIENINPLNNAIADSNLLAINKQIRSTFFINRTGYKYGASYTYQDNNSKVLLSNGFDFKQTVFHEITTRYKIKKILFNLDNQTGTKRLTSSYLSSRNYAINYVQSLFKTTYQKDANQFFTINYKFEEKENTLDTDFATIHTIGAEATYNIINNISLSTLFNYLTISYNGLANTSVEYEMLAGLKKGDNFTWEILLNKRIAKNLSLTLNYNGRKPQGIKTIHAGTVEVRAFF